MRLSPVLKRLQTDSAPLGETGTPLRGRRSHEMMARLRNAAAIFVFTVGLGFLAWRWRPPEPVEVILKPTDRETVERTVANTRTRTVKACRRAWLSP